MVTQSAGPYTAAAMGMALAAYECRNQTAEAQVKYLEQASYTISHARPTTVERMKLITEGCLAAAKRAIAAGRTSVRRSSITRVESNNLRYNKIGKMAKYLVDMFPDNGAGHDPVLRRDDRRPDAQGGEEPRQRTSACSAPKRARTFRARA